MTIQELLSLTIKNKASDLHLLVGIPPSIRIDGELHYLTNYPATTNEVLEQMIFSLLKPDQKEYFLTNKELDFSFGFGGGQEGTAGRFRTNLYYQRGFPSAAFRFLEPNIRTVEELRLPKICHSFALLK